MSNKTFSLSAVVATALITFVVSGIGGAILSEWLARAQPLLTISAIGFSGTEKQVAVSDLLRTATKKSSWTPRRRKFESFATLEKDYKNAERIKLRLESGIALVEEWLKSNAVELEIENNPLTLKQLDSTPYMQDEIVGSALVGMARRGELSAAPVDLASLEKGIPVTELTKANGRYLLYMGNKNVAFPFENADTQTEVKQIEHLAQSFAYGSSKNIVYFMKRMAEASNREIRQLINLLEIFKSSMLPVTSLSVRSEIFNSGRKPLVVKPYALLRVLNEDIEQTDYLLRLSPRVTSQISPQLEIFSEIVRRQTNSSSGRDVVVEGFLPTVEDRSYVLVPPSGSVSLQLTSDAALGASGSRLRAIFDANVLRVKLILATDNGDQIHSGTMIFGASANTNVQNELTRIE